MTDVLPKGWVRSTIEALAGPDGFMADGDWIESKDQDPTGEVRLIQLADIGDGKFLNKSHRFVTHQTAKRLRCTYLEPGDLLVARMPDPLGRACVFPGVGQPAITAVDVCVWRGGLNGADPRWLMHAINSPEVRDALAMLAGGTTRQRVSGGNLKRFVLPAPPLAEQRRIVARIEALFARTRSARADLNRIAPLALRYRQRRIAKTIEPGGRSGFVERSIADIANVVTGSTPPTSQREHYGGSTPFIKPTDLDVGYNVISGREGLTNSGVSISRPIPVGSTLLTCIGATIGKAGYARVECVTNQQINALVPKAAFVDSSWLFWAVVSPMFQEEILSNSSATTLPIINKKRMEMLRLEVPSLEVQRSGVKQLDIHLPAAARVSLEATRALALLDHLEKSILTRAVRGELMPRGQKEPALPLETPLPPFRKANGVR